MAQVKTSPFDALRYLTETAKDISTANVSRTCDLIETLARIHYADDSMRTSMEARDAVGMVCHLTYYAAPLESEKHHRICSSIETLARIQHGIDTVDYDGPSPSVQKIDELRDKDSYTSNANQHNLYSGRVNIAHDLSNGSTTDTTQIFTPDPSVIDPTEPGDRPTHIKPTTSPVSDSENINLTYFQPPENLTAIVAALVTLKEYESAKSDINDLLNKCTALYDNTSSILAKVGLESENKQERESEDDEVAIIDWGCTIDLGEDRHLLSDNDSKDQHVHIEGTFNAEEKALLFEIGGCSQLPSYAPSSSRKSSTSRSEISGKPDESSPKSQLTQSEADIIDATAQTYKRFKVKTGSLTSGASTTNISEIADTKPHIESKDTPNMASQKAPVVENLSSVRTESVDGSSTHNTLLPEEDEGRMSPFEERLTELICLGEMGGLDPDHDEEELREMFTYCPTNLRGDYCKHGSRCQLKRLCSPGYCSNRAECTKDHNMKGTCLTMLRPAKCKRPWSYCRSSCRFGHEHSRRAVDTKERDHREGLYGVEEYKKEPF